MSGRLVLHDGVVDTFGSVSVTKVSSARTAITIAASILALAEAELETTSKSRSCVNRSKGIDDTIVQ